VLFGLGLLFGYLAGVTVTVHLSRRDDNKGEASHVV
jgi:hypothetical protein